MKKKQIMNVIIGGFAIALSASLLIRLVISQFVYFKNLL